jgi:glycerol-3-phosphate dehydrogenase
MGDAVPQSRTDQIPLVGAGRLDATRIKLRAHGLDGATCDRLVARYGSLATEVAELTVDGGAGPLAAEAAYAVTHEGALGLEDVLARRTRLAVEAADGGAAVAPEVAEIMRRALGWTAERTTAEVASYRHWLGRERAPLQ